jgi:uncharacterized protein YPO0396
MSQRISLTRIVAIHWYGFRQIFDVDDNVLISGAFGTGKSALLDLVQYVLLGENWRANRAAAGTGAYRASGEKASRGRDLAGYCLGDTNQMRNGERHFLRRSGVTLVALEFTRNGPNGAAGPSRETWGIRLEFSSPEAAPKHTYFLVPDRLEYAAIAPGNELLSDDAFRTWVRREFGNECLFARQRDYLEEMAAPRHLNFDVHAFQRTFPKAIAFEPEENVEKFIREFILEESPLDVRDVRAALRAYDDTRRRLEKQEDEAAFLRRIRECHTLWERARREEATLQHTSHALKLAQAEERRDRHAAELHRLELAHADDQKSLQKSRTEAAEVDRLLADVRFEIQGDPDAVKIAGLEGQRSELHDNVVSLREAQRTARGRLDDRHRSWMDWLRHGAALSLPGLADALVVDDALLARLRSGSDSERLEVMPRLAQRFSELWSTVRDLVRPLEDEVKSARGRLNQLQTDLEHLSKGQAPGAFPVFQALRQKMGARVEQMGRLIEVKPEAERWWPALELFLGSARWTIVVNSAADYREALEIVRKTAPGREIEALLHPGEAREIQAAARADSLFTRVETIHPVVRPYLEQLLGAVQCVDSVEELERCESRQAITPEGVAKQAPLRRRIRPAGTVELTLGRQGLERMRAAKTKELGETGQELEARQRQLADVQTWLDHGRKAGLADGTLPERSAELGTLPQAEAQLGRLQETILLLLTPEREARQARLRQLELRHRAALSSIAVLLDRQNRFELTTRPEREGLARAQEDVLTARVATEESRASLARQCVGVLDAELLRLRQEFRESHPRWADCFEAVLEASKDAGLRAGEARARRHQERMQLATSRDEHGQVRHPEYQHEFVAEDDSNDPWDARLRVLETVELEKSRELAADRKRDWERRLEENVLNELNRRITEAQNTIRLLDRYLAQPIGRFRYRISQRRDQAGHGPIWRLLDSGLEATDPLAAAIQGPEIQRAKDELMQAVDAPDQEDERVRRLLDYRNYHHYDLEMVPADKPDAPPISLGRSGRNLSGGENQAPFFISMLAAFRRVYDRGDRSSTRSQQLGLVVMDEAFSKLSGDGIEDCLALARSFQLQLVMAFPPERLGVMVPHAQTVVMCQKEVERDAEGYVTRISTLPLITTMADAVDALS